MDTLSFFKKILPSEGLKMLAELVPVAGRDKPGWRYTTFQSFDAIAEAVAQIDATGRTIYHACNSFGDWYEDKGKRRIRTQQNVVACRSLFDDIDTGKPGAYETKGVAYSHVCEFLAASKMPKPMVVDSGGGLHLYWPLTRDISKEEWQRLSDLKRAALKQFGVKADFAVNGDSARVLRPVGSTWRKNGERIVKVKLDSGPYDSAELEQILLAYVEDAALPQRREARFEITLDGVAVTYPPSSIAIIAEHCQQIREFRDTGSHNEPHWHASIGIAKHCVDGEALMHEWSMKYPGYNKAECQQKYENWSVGPTTCAMFKEKFAEGCKGCKQAVSSPIQLGPVVETAPPVLEVVNEVTGAVETWSPPYWPEKYSWRNSRITTIVNEDGEAPKSIVIAEPLFYPTERVQADDGTWMLGMKAEISPGKWREFTIPTKSIMDGKTLRGELGSYEITTYNPNLASRYMNDFLAVLRRERDEKLTYKQFGWQHDFTGFLIGDTLLTENGPVTVRLSENEIKDDTLHLLYRPKGDIETWVNGVDVLYNRPGLEPYQYTIATVFGSVLVPLLDHEQWNGIPLALTTEDSGFGKSTVALIGINALYRSGQAMMSDMTAKAVVGRASMMGNLVVLFDEAIRNLMRNEDELSDVLYALSNGRGRVGMQSDGTERKPRPPFKLNTILTGNRNVMFQLTESRINPIAAQMRVFEVDLEDYYHGKKPPFATGQEETVMKLVNGLSGVLAAPYITYIIKNIGEIREQLARTNLSIMRALGSTANKERFYAHHMACSLVGASIAKKMGWIRFSINDMKKWAFDHVLKLRGIAVECQKTPDDTLSAFLADLHGSILITKNYDILDARLGKTELPWKELREAPKARLVLGNDLERGKLFVSNRAIDTWCAKNGVSARGFKRQLQNFNLIRLGPKGEFDRRMYLSKGVPTHPSGQCKCIEIEYAAAQGYIRDFIQQDNVVAIQSKAEVAPTKKEPPGALTLEG